MSKSISNSDESSKTISNESGLVLNQFRLTPGATDGYVLTSDDQGNGTWQESTGGTSIYTDDGVLTSNRIVDANNNSLTFDNISSLTFDTPTITAVDSTMTIRGIDIPVPTFDENGIGSNTPLTMGTYSFVNQEANYPNRLILKFSAPPIERSILEFNNNEDTSKVFLTCDEFFLTSSTADENKFLRSAGTDGLAEWADLPNPLTDTGVVAGTYGSATSVPIFTVDAQGRLTSASGNTIPNWTNATQNLLTTGTITGSQHITPGNGTVSEPAFKVGTSGIYQSAAGTLALSAGGSNVATFTSGIGSISVGSLGLTGGLGVNIIGGLGITMTSQSVTIDIPSKSQGAGAILTQSNASGNLVYVAPIYLEANWTGNAVATNVTTTGAFVKADVLPVISGVSSSTNWTTTSNRLNWTGATRVMHVHITCSLTVSAFTNYAIAIYRNGVQIASSVERSSSGSTNLNIATQALVSMATNDFIELWVTNLANTFQDPTVTDATFIITGV